MSIRGDRPELQSGPRQRSPDRSACAACVRRCLRRWSHGRDEPGAFEELVREALDEVPAELLDAHGQRRRARRGRPPAERPDLLGLYEGHALTERGWDYAGVLPDRITIYRNPTLRDLRHRGRRRRRGRTSPWCTRSRTTSASTTSGCTNSAGAERGGPRARPRPLDGRAGCTGAGCVAVPGSDPRRAGGGGRRAGSSRGRSRWSRTRGTCSPTPPGVGLALGATALAARPATPARTFGWQRAEMLAALVNGLVIGVVGVGVLVGGVRRLVDPGEVEAGLMLGIAAVGLAANAVGLLLLRRGQGESLNVRGAYLEVLGDVLGSVAVVVAAVVVLATGFARRTGSPPSLSGCSSCRARSGCCGRSPGCCSRRRRWWWTSRRCGGTSAGSRACSAVHDLHAWIDLRPACPLLFGARRGLRTSCSPGVRACGRVLDDLRALPLRALRRRALHVPAGAAVGDRPRGPRARVRAPGGV